MRSMRSAFGTDFNGTGSIHPLPRAPLGSAPTATRDAIARERSRRRTGLPLPFRAQHSAAFPYVWRREQSAANQSQLAEFPDNRENTANFLDLGSDPTVFTPSSHACSMAYEQIPYSVEQGNSETEQGKSACQQGISCEAQPMPVWD